MHRELMKTLDQCIEKLCINHLQLPYGFYTNRALAKEAEDNWKSRIKGMKCKTCMWFVPKGDSAMDIGRCRKHAPTLGGWPVTYSSDWCGDHKIDEDKA